MIAKSQPPQGLDQELDHGLGLLARQFGLCLGVGLCLSFGHGYIDHEIERLGDADATVHKALVGIRDPFEINVDGGADMSAHGNIVDHEYEIERDGDTVAAVSKKWFQVRETYGVEIQPGQDDALILAIAVCVEP